ncbi:MAG: lysophospholipid acyltransferase family protein [Terriglobales bacterium]
MAISTEGAPSPLRPWTRGERALLLLARHVAPTLITALGRSVRVELPLGLPPEAAAEPPQAAIYAFWHRGLLPITWFCQGRGFGILISRNFDGELITRVAERLRYRTFRGSSSRGGAEAMTEMSAALQGGQPIGLTVDGPRGPRFRAKLGPVVLARITGAPLYAVHAACSRARVLASWDRFQIPLPGSRVRAAWAGPIVVPPDASRELLETKRQELEDTLNRLRHELDSAFGPPQD